MGMARWYIVLAYTVTRTLAMFKDFAKNILYGNIDMTSLLINPTQLFSDTKHLHDFSKIIIYEEPKFFTKFKYHKQKLILHRASCRWYYDRLKSKGFNVQYVEFSKNPKPTHIYEPFDHELTAKYHDCNVIASHNFLITPEFVENCRTLFFDGKHFSHEKFYKLQRRRLNVLMNGTEPKGGKWSFDMENRKKIPSNEKVPPRPNATKSPYITEATTYVNKHWPNNPGDDNIFIWPITHTGAQQWLAKFIAGRFSKFGKYQDASLEGEAILYHSAITPVLNIGLITDRDVLNAVSAANVPIASKEGFIRQLIGWRNYMMAIYLLRGKQLQKMNYWEHGRRMPYSWWNGTTQIEPIDDIIKNKILKYAFTHHIERLMYLGVWAFLNHIRPTDVYEWFMEMTIDAYEWVMIPNVYGMSQNADNNMVMKRLYICSSNYILKMSNYAKGEWCAKWDTLYYCHINRLSRLSTPNYFYSAQIYSWKHRTTKEKKEILKMAKQLINDHP